MTREAITSAIETYATENWEQDADLVFANQPAKNKPNEAWVRLSVMDAGSQTEVITGDPDKGEKFYGVVMCNVFTPANKGTTLSAQLKDALRALFYGKSIAVTGKGPVVFEVKSDSSPGADDVWFQENIAFPFEEETL
jgi:hypothetical protein